MCDLKEKAKTAAAFAAPAVMSGLMTITSFAGEEVTDPGVTESVSTALVTAVTDIANSIGGVIGQVIPVALPLIGAGLVVTVGIRIFRTVVSKA